MAKRGIGYGLMESGSALFGQQAQGDPHRAGLPSGPLRTFRQAVEEDGTVPSGYTNLILMDVDERAAAWSSSGRWSQAGRERPGP